MAKLPHTRAENEGILPGLSGCELAASYRYTTRLHLQQKKRRNLQLISIFATVFPKGGSSMEALPVFRERLLLARRRADLTQEELAARAGLHKTDVSKMERGRMLPTAPRLRRLCVALGVSADFLLGLVEDKQPIAA
jgi:ribosome-binding protein aMBF1 (putative translation factor)